MRTSSRSVVARSAALWLVLVVVGAALARALPGRVAAARVDIRDPARLDALLVLGAVGTLLVVTGWAALLASAELLHALGSARAGRALERCCPAPWRRAVLLACGVAAAAALPAQAGDRHPPAPGTASGTATPLAGLPALDRPTGTVPARHRPPAPAGRPHPIRVRPGDSLWRIVRARHPEASAAEVVRLVGELYRANRAAIGPDPDLIRPGARLRPAEPSRARSDPSDTPRRRR
jgi:hypothetical protein